MDTDHKKCSEKGFSLIEIAVAMVIIGLLIAPMIQIYNINHIEKKKRENDAKVEAISVALNKYAQQKHEFPVPSVATQTVADAQYGLSGPKNLTTPCSGFLALTGVRCVMGDDNAESIASGLGNDVLIGAVPFKDLGLNEEDSFDIYGSKLTYAISRNLVDKPADLSGRNGSISLVNLEGDALKLNDGDDSVLNASGQGRVLFAVISHGPNRAGAFQRDGSLIACSANNDLDTDNCNRPASVAASHSTIDGVFRASDSIILKDDGTPLLRASDGQPARQLTKSFRLGKDIDFQFYDDTISYRTKASDETWTAVREDNSTENTYMTKPMYTVIGSAMATGVAPKAIVTVNGDGVMTKKALSETLCDENDNCFRIKNITGPAAEGGVDTGTKCYSDEPLNGFGSETDTSAVRTKSESKKYLKRTCDTIPKADPSDPIKDCGAKGISGFDSLGNMICAP